MHLIQNLLALCPAASVLAAPTSLQTRQTTSTLQGKNLTILPLGDSITYGMGHPSSNSYRASLQTTLLAAGASTNYVGTVQSGTMADNSNEGHIGWTIEQISGAATSAAATGIEADVVLLHAGTNDLGTYGWEEAYVRLGELVDVVGELWPGAAVLVAEIVPSRTVETQAHIVAFNGEVQGVVDARAKAGMKVSVVDMGSALDAATDLSDDLHPNDSGYEKMAAVWFDGLSAASGKGWI